MVRIVNFFRHGLVGIFVAIVFAVFASPVSAGIVAGEMVIEEGTVFSDSFTKDGRRVELTKTYRSDGVHIHQRIYDEATGELIRDKTRVNPLKDHVTVTSAGLDHRNTDAADHEDDRVPPTQTPAPTATTRPTLAPIENSPPPKTDDAIEETDESPEEAQVGPDNLIESASARYGLSRVNDVFVNSSKDRSEIRFDGVKQERLLGLFSVELPVELTVDAKSGEILTERKSLRTKVMDFLSI